MAEYEYTTEVLEQAPERVTRFLQALGAVPIIRTLLAGAGMTDGDVAEGRTLLLACLAEPRGPSPELDTEDAKTQRASVAELDQWDEPNFARYGASLRRHAPSAHAYVFEGLKATTGAAAVNGVATFLVRLDDLERGSRVNASKKEDANAMAVLEARGLTRAERKRLRKLVDIALGPTTPLAALPEGDPDEQRLEKLSELRTWFDEWSAAARAVVKKRQYLIRLGLASRRTAKGEPETPETPEVPATPTAPAPAQPA